MEERRARELLQDEGERLQRLLRERDEAGQSDRAAADDDPGASDSGEILTAEGADNAVAGGLRARLAAVRRAEERLDAGTFGLSIRSGKPIPDERLEADPAAELTVEEAARG